MYSSLAEGVRRPPESSPRHRFAVLVVGGMERLAPRYRAAEEPVDVVVVNGNTSSLERALRGSEAVVLIRSHISHAAADKVRRWSRRHGVVLRIAAGPGVSEVRRAIHDAAECLAPRGALASARSPTPAKAA